MARALSVRFAPRPPMRVLSTHDFVRGAESPDLALGGDYFGYQFSSALALTSTGLLRLVNRHTNRGHKQARKAEVGSFKCGNCLVNGFD